MVGSTSFKLALVSGTALAAVTALPGAALAQDVPVSVSTVSEEDLEQQGTEDTLILVTGSRIKRDPNDSSLPLQIISNEELTREGISSPEQLMMYLPSSGTGPDNLASNGDVVSGAQRGTNGLSGANLRGQGSAATLVLLNGRRVAAHGLSGSAVDVNQIPFAAIERVEVLKDGASAIYGTDAVGGVINFITKTDYQGFGAQGFVDIPEAGGGGQIYRLSAVAGYGDLNEDGFNIMGAVAHSWNRGLRGVDRDFVNGNQPNRGLSIDTRGTPIATMFNIAANTHQTPLGTLLTGLTLTTPNGSNGAAGGINILDLPGGAGCDSMADGMAYDEVLWNVATAQYACSWDTSRAAMITQPINTLTYYGRGVVDLSGHRISVEVTGSDANSSKIFSPNQYTANNTNLPWAYPLNALTAPTYNAVFNQLRAAFTDPAQRAALDARYGRPIAGRWRCVVCGPREYETNTKTFRIAAGVEGPLFEGWDYRAGASYAKSESSSLLGTGYHFRGVRTADDPATTGVNETGMNDTRAPTAPGASGPGIIGLINSGILNPFSLAQTPEAIAALDAVSAEGTTLYGGRYEVKQFDASVSGPLFAIWGGDVQLAAGVDYRIETYSFNGSAAAAANMPDIFNVAFDNVNALTPKERTVKAAYAEILVPIVKGVEVTGALRTDDYTGFGSTTNPKVSFKIQPIDQIMFRGSYNTSFRVPTFNQIFNGATVSPSATGANVVNPFTCPSLIVSTTPGSPCLNITPDIVTGGNESLGPETAKQFNLGVVLQPAPRFSASLDWWVINVDNTITELTVAQLLANAALFPERFLSAPGSPSQSTINLIDRRWINAGARRTQGLELSLRGGIETGETGVISVGLDGTYLLKKKEKLTQTAPYGPSLVGIFTYTGDLGIRWKHNAFISFTNDSWALSFSQIFREGYKNNALPSLANPRSAARPDYNQFVEDYAIYNMSLSYLGLGPNYKLTLGVRNLFDKDPPFAITYESNLGGGGAWEPRAHDPRGRSFTVGAEFKF